VFDDVDEEDSPAFDAEANPRCASVTGSPLVPGGLAGPLFGLALQAVEKRSGFLWGHCDRRVARRDIRFGLPDSPLHCRMAEPELTLRDVRHHAAFHT
jgi:hypothetical protein